MEYIKRLTVVVAFLSLFCGVSFAGETVTLNKIVYELFTPSSGQPYANIVESRHSKDTPFSLTLPSEIKLEGTTYEVREINASAFKGSAIEKLVIPGTIEWIRDFAFYGCSNLKEVVLEAGDTKIKIHYGSFSGAPIENVFLDRNIFYDYNIFSQNSPYWDYKDPTNIFGTNIRQLEIGNCVNYINRTFADCTHLESVHIPETLEEIGSSTFKNCTSLKEITIPGTLKEIGWDAFYGCSSLKKVVFEAGDKNLKVRKSVFSHSGVQQVILNRNVDSEKALFDYTVLSKAEIGPEVTYIGASFFQGSYYLRSIMIPGTVKSIGASAFENCENLSEVILEEGLTEIDYRAFSGCNSLEKINFLPEGLKKLSGSFADCKNLKNIKLPSTLEIIGTYTFKNCEKLTSISIPNQVTSIEFEAFANVPLITMILEDSNTSVDLNINISCFGREEVSIYDDFYDDWYSKYKAVLPSTIKSFYLGRNIVLDNRGVNVTPPSTQSFLGECHLENFTMLPELKVIPKYFFSGWTVDTWRGLPTIKLPFSVERLSLGCFQNCSGLNEVILPPSLKEIGPNAFTDSRIQKLYVMATTPPEAAYDPFDDNHYKYTQLIVPTESIDLYNSTEPWSNFLNIVGSDFASVDDVEVSDDMPAEWYDLKGRKVSGENMPAGIYIRRQGSKVEKVIIR